MVGPSSGLNFTYLLCPIETTLAPEVEEATTITNVPEVEVVTEVAKKDAAEPLIIEKKMTTPPPVKEEVKGLK